MKILNLTGFVIHQRHYIRGWCGACVWSKADIVSAPLPL
jgi:hypothetical protein